MQIDKLNENKIRITLNLEDLKEKKIDLHSFMSSSIESQEIFYDMLDTAEREIGFKTKNYKLMIEVLAIPDGKFILTITRFSPEQEEKKRLKVKRKNVYIESNSSMYMFNTFDDYLDFCNFIKKYLTTDTYSSFKKASLYQYNSKYYLCVNNINLNVLKNMHCSIIEFATLITNSDLFERKLIEYGKVIFKTNAITESLKYFCNY